MSVPAVAATLTTVRNSADPRRGAHPTVVADVHALLPHTSAAVSEAVADVPAASKLRPLIVTEPLAVGAALAVAALTTGADIGNNPCSASGQAGHGAYVAPSKVKMRLQVSSRTLIHASLLARTAAAGPAPVAAL